MDPVTAVGLTAAVVQLLTFSEGLFRRSHEIYKSTDGVLVQHEELEAVTASFSELLRGLQKQRRNVLNEKRSNIEKYRSMKIERGAFSKYLKEAEDYEQQTLMDSEIEKLAAEASLLADELLETIGRLKSADTSCKPWSSMRQAFLSIMKEGKLKDLESRITRLRSQIDTTLLVSVRNYVQQLNAKQDRFTLHLNRRLDQLVEETTSYSSAIKEVRKQVDREKKKPWMMNQTTPNFTEMIMEEAAANRESLLRSRVRESLRFDDMPNRYQAIPDAYRSTFEWIFEEKYSPFVISNDDACPVEKGQISRDTFSSWLASNQKLYWISGKPGAGKSTLMKFLANDPRSARDANTWIPKHSSSTEEKSEAVTTHDLIKIDGDTPQLRSGAYFFWNPGSKMQKSKLGFCQTLLHDLLVQDMDRIEHVLPDRWARYTLFGDDYRPFTWHELWTALKKLLSFQDRRFLLFIDGLDEIEDNPAELASTVLEIASWENTKVCAASRPWLEFEDHFRDAPRLQVEELTRSDIFRYTNDQLNNSPAFQLLHDYDAEKARNIIKDVVDRACGVFLWVYVVVGSLLEGLRDGDDLLSLEQRLHELPTELDDLFTKILKQVSPRYAIEASELFQFIRQHPDNATMLNLYLAHQPLSVALKAKIRQTSEKQLAYPLDVMRRKIYSRCKCLIQVSSPCQSHTKVTYLHRTVRDYLLLPHVWEGIRNQSPGYDPDAALAISLLQKLKMDANLSGFITKPGKLFELDLLDAVCLMAYSSAVTVEEKVSFLDEVANTRTVLRVSNDYSNTIEPFEEMLDLPWVGADFGSHMLLQGARLAIPCPTTMYQIAFGSDIDWYVDAKLNKNPNLLTAPILGRYPLHYAVNCKLWLVVKVLLAHGADPNHKNDIGMSPWLELLDAAQSYHEHVEELAGGRTYLQMLSLFLDKGASPRVTRQDLKPEQVIEKLLTKMKATEYSRDREAVSRNYELALKKNRNGRRLTFKGIWS